MSTSYFNMSLQAGDCKELSAEKDFEFSQVWDVFNALRLQGKLCDVVLEVGDRKFEAHRAILAANSPYFRAMFTNGMQETQQREVKLRGIDPTMMSLIIEYIYTRTVRVDMENVMSLLSVADCFSVNGLTDACVEYMKTALGYENCFTILRFSKAYYRQDLTIAAKKFINTNFKRIICSTNKEFLECCLEDLIDTLSDDFLNVSEEQEVFEAGVQWVQWNEELRHQYMPQILRQVRISNVDPSELLERISSNRLCKAPASREAIECFREALNGAKMQLKDKVYSHPLLRPRIPHGVLFAVGGWSGGTPISKIETYDCKADQWYSFPQLQDKSPRAYHGLVVFKGRIYIIGGFNGTDYYNSVRYFDPLEKRWHNASPMYTPRCYVSTAHLNDHIYACGGYDGRFRLNSVERYHPPTNQWTKVASMTVNRSDAGADSLHGKVYIAGGFNGDQCLCSAECYDPCIDQWTMIRSMSCTRSGLAVCVYNGTIYVVGGFDGESRLKSGERYNHIHNTWERIPDMLSQRSNCAVSVLDGMLMAMGGFNGSLTISCAECFDEETNTWYDAADMSINRSALKAVVMTDLENVKEYTFHGQPMTDAGSFSDSD